MNIERNKIDSYKYKTSVVFKCHGNHTTETRYVILLCGARTQTLTGLPSEKIESLEM